MTAMTVIDPEKAAFGPLFIFSVCWLGDIEYDRYTVFVVIPQQTLVSDGWVSSDNAIPPHAALGGLFIRDYDPSSRLKRQLLWLCLFLCCDFMDHFRNIRCSKLLYLLICPSHWIYFDLLTYSSGILLEQFLRVNVHLSNVLRWRDGRMLCLHGAARVVLVIWRWLLEELVLRCGVVLLVFCGQRSAWRREVINFLAIQAAMSIGWGKLRLGSSIIEPIVFLWELLSERLLLVGQASHILLEPNATTLGSWEWIRASALSLRLELVHLRFSMREMRWRIARAVVCRRPLVIPRRK